VPLTAAKESAYPIIDSKVPVDEQTHPVWLNNDQVLFMGFELDPANPPKHAETGWLIPRGAYVWNVAKETVVRDHSWDGTTNWCVSNNFRSFLRLRSDTEKTYDLMTGTPGKEQVQAYSSKHWFNRISCRYYTTLPYWRQESGKDRFIPLLEEHGYLDFGLPSRADPSKSSLVQLYRPNEKDPQQLPFTGEQVRLHVDYFEFANAYLLEGYRETTYATRIWLLKPDGTVTTALEPAGKAWERMGWGHYQLTKKGLFLIGGTSKYDQTNTTGGYLLIDGEPKRLVPGFLRNVAVSPNGCKIVFVHALHSKAEADSVKALREGKPGTRTLKMIDLCQGDQ
jgi:hypothetical protein